MQPLLRRRLLSAVLVLLLCSSTALAANVPHARLLAFGLLVVTLLLVAYVLIRGEAPRAPQPQSQAEEEPASADMLESLASFDTTLRIGDETLEYLKQGLNEESAQKICEMIHKITDVDAVAITDDEKILGFVGIGCRRHRPGGPILTGATKRVLESGEPMNVTDPRILACDEHDCPHPLHSAIIAPLRYRGRVVGTFKLYRSSHGPMPTHMVRLAVGIAALLGIQMELGEVDRQRELVARARLEALQAQIRPHFLFNVLNTIIHLTRTDVNKARDLLITLSQFFRRALANRGNVITLADEVEYINTYLSLEKARFGDKLEVRVRLAPDVLGVHVPILTLQPLVENAVVHGLAPKEEGGFIAMRARRVGEELHVFICDNGIGMDREHLRRVVEEGYGDNMGLGLSNVNERLISLYGEEYGLQIRSRAGSGTAIRVRIPLAGTGSQEGHGNGAQGADRR